MLLPLWSSAHRQLLIPIHDVLPLTNADRLPPMAAHLRSALRSTSHHRPTFQSSVRHLTRYSPAKAQVQPVTQTSTADSLPIPDEPFSEYGHRSPPTSSVQPETDLPKTSQAFFDATGVLWVGVGNDQPPDPNKAKLGKSKLSTWWPGNGSEASRRTRTYYSNCCI
jgi:hypothetical protein